MARGITEPQVFDAADALLGRGLRPTIERIRQELGRGSPNTVNRFLDAWWKRLGERLRLGQAAVPGRPPELEAAFEKIWAVARIAAEGTLAEKTQADRQTVEQQVQDVARARQQLDTDRAAFEHARGMLHDELAGLRGMIADREQINTGLREDKAELERRLSQVNQALQGSQAEVTMRDEQLLALRDRLAGTEKHFHEKIAALQAVHDRETRRHKAELDQVARARSTAQDALETLRRALASSQADLAASRAEAAASARSEQALRVRMDRQAKQLEGLAGNVRGLMKSRRGEKPTRPRARRSPAPAP